MSESDSNFFSRWSRRKAELREAAAVPGPVAQANAAPAPVVAELPQAPAQPLQPTPAAPPAPPAAPPAPTLADVDALTTQSDYTRFVARDVSPEVKQAALKKLFTDPHFNVMDGLDTYIDDYGKPDPLPPGMLRKMAQSQLLGLFDHEKKAATEGSAPPQASAAGPVAVDPSHDLPLPANTPAADVRVDLPPAPEAGSPGPDDPPAHGNHAAALPNPPEP